MPRLPNLDKATIERRKITHYLLARDHPIGRAKAGFFEGFGFHRDWPETLEMYLIMHAHENDVSEVIATDFGMKFIISGSMRTPIGVRANVCVVWFAEDDQAAPRLVTAFPD